MVFVAGVLIALVLLLVLATGAAALPIALLIPIAGLVVYLVWMLIRRAFTRTQ